MNYRRILGRIEREEFVGRDRELDQIARHASRSAEARGLLLLAAPPAGVSELLRQAFDQLFAQRGDAIPIYFSLTQHDGLAVDAAVRFFTTFLQQYIAYRRVDPSLCEAPLSLKELVELALPTDYEWIAGLAQSFERENAAGDTQALIQLCLGTPQKAAAAGQIIFPMIDGVHFAGDFRGRIGFGRQLAEIIARSKSPFAIAGPRRQVMDLIREADDVEGASPVIHLERLDDAHAARLVEQASRRYEVEINEQTRDLMVQQFAASPFFITSMMQAAQQANTPLNSFVNCQRVYVDQLLGGQINRYFASIFDRLTPDAQIRKNLLRVLYESLLSETHKSSLWTWKKRIGADASEFEHIVHQLHVRELVNSSGSFVEVNSESTVWLDYLRATYRVEGAGEPRALVVADTLTQTLKRAPRTMARHYRRESAVGLRDLLARFNCQEVAATLFHDDRFKTAYKGIEPEQVAASLDAEADLIRLPQIVHVAACGSFTATSRFGDEERCAVGHGFEAADYVDQSEIVWLAAEVESKLEAGRELAQEWFDRLTDLARRCGFAKVRVWLIAPEGFSAEACRFLTRRSAYASSRRQIELLSARIKPGVESREAHPDAANEYELVIPMGQDTELIAAHAVEQIARRLNFPAQAINQIKTALIEASINAAEHSLSPDRKIYQRFRAENDKLVVTVTSRGIVPADMRVEVDGRTVSPSDQNRRGWGLKLIRTLMDEVEFEHVDDGTQLRMVKYLKK